MKDKKLRTAVKDLCYMLGISYDEMWGPTVGTYSTIEGGDLDKRPLTFSSLKPIRDAINKLTEEHNLLLNHLGLEVFEGKEIRKKINK